jgi:Flp pilus assembly pilin Flp
MRPSRGQTILEYTIIVGIVAVVLYYMATGIKRGVQSLVKITADQVGPQQNADQDFSGLQGFVQTSNTSTQQSKNTQLAEIGYIPSSGNAIYVANKAYQESSYTAVNSITNGGFIPSTQ